MDTVRTGRTETKDTTPKTHANDSAIEIKGSVFTLPVLKINSTDIQRIEHTLQHHLSQSLSFFKNAPIVIDLERTKQSTETLDLVRLTQLLRNQHLVPVAVQKGSLEQHLAAEQAGLAILTGQSSGKTQTSSLEAAMSSKEIAEDDKAPTQDNADIAPTKVVKQPIRSGQRIYARGGDLVLLGAVNAGAEIIADGNIHIYAPLRGRALAGVRGDEEARIFCHCFEAELVAIAGTYRVFEDKPPKDIYQQAVQILLRGEQLDIVPIDH